MAIYALGDRVPTIDESAYVHPDASVIGLVEIGPEATVWAGAVLRGDYGRIVVGARTSVQDGTVVHATHELDTIIGSDCVVGHNAHLEGCTIEPVVPPHAQALGIPAKIKPDSVADGSFGPAVALYVANGKRYKAELRRLD
jgi:serine acetyltransferase